MIAARSRGLMGRFAMALPLAAAGTAALADDSLFTSTAGLDKAGGAEIYSHICQGCHMPEGRGAIGAGRYPKLAGDPALVSWQYAAIRVLNGKGGMPAFGLPTAQALEIRAVHLSDAQVADIVNYVRNNFGNRYGGRVTAREVAALPHPESSLPTD